MTWPLSNSPPFGLTNSPPGQKWIQWQAGAVKFARTGSRDLSRHQTHWPTHGWDHGLVNLAGNPSGFGPMKDKKDH